MLLASFLSPWAVPSQFLLQAPSWALFSLTLSSFPGQVHLCPLLQSLWLQNGSKFCLPRLFFRLQNSINQCPRSKSQPGSDTSNSMIMTKSVIYPHQLPEFTIFMSDTLSAQVCRPETCSYFSTSLTPSCLIHHQVLSICLLNLSQLHLLCPFSHHFLTQLLKKKLPKWAPHPLHTFHFVCSLYQP